MKLRCIDYENQRVTQVMSIDFQEGTFIIPDEECTDLVSPWTGSTEEHFLDDKQNQIVELSSFTDATGNNFLWEGSIVYYKYSNGNLYVGQVCKGEFEYVPGDQIKSKKCDGFYFKEIYSSWTDYINSDVFGTICYRQQQNGGIDLFSQNYEPLEDNKFHIVSNMLYSGYWLQNHIRRIEQEIDAERQTR